jgi:CBS domain-containing protein
MNIMKCRDIMKKNPKFVSPEDTIQTAAQLMRDQNIGFLPICDETRRVLGVLTDRDIVVRAIAEGLPAETVCLDVMTKNVAVCRQQDELGVVHKLMGQHQVSRVCCVDDQDTLLGVISLSDLADFGAVEAVAQTLQDVTDRERA